MDLAPRKCLENPSGTPTNVGPGTYTLTFPTCKYPKKNYAPFLSFAKRVTAKPILYTDQIYDLSACRSKIPYGNSLQFTAPRNTFDIRVEPIRVDLIKKPRIHKPEKKINYGRLLLCRVPFSTGVNAPTIPTTENENGYDLTEDNELIKMSPNFHDTSLGPAFYNVPSGELCSNSQRYRGCAWSKMKEKRDKSSTAKHPGPADYDVKFIPCVRRHEDEKFRELMRKCCNVPRYTCMLICKAKNENLPGPGYYETVNVNKIGELKNLTLGRKPFITTDERKTLETRKGPGPADYAVCDCFKHRNDYSLKKIAFSTEAPRFKRATGHPSPAPCDYNINVRKCIRYNEDKHPAPFTTSAPRKMLEITSLTPAPGEYEINDITCCPQEIKQKTSVFRSKTLRFSRPKAMDGVSPASCDITRAFKLNTESQSHAKGKKVAFKSTEEKFTRIYDFAGTTVGMDTPGVGQYNISTDLFEKGKTFPVDLRYPVKAYEKRPGPLTYELHPSVGKAVYRAQATHNVRLMKDVNKRLQRFPLDVRQLCEAKKKTKRKKRNITTMQDYDSDMPFL